MAKKIKRKELLRTDDAFVQTADQSAVWLVAHKKWVFGAAVAVLVIGLGGWGASVQMSSNARARSAQLHGVYQLLQARVVTEAADPQASPPTFANLENKWKAVAQALDDVPEQGLGDAGLVLKNFYAAHVAVERGDVEHAEALLGQLVSTLSPQDSLYFLAVERLAYLLEGKGDVAGALQRWQPLANLPADRFHVDAARYQRARLLVVDGQREEAAKLLETLQHDFPESTYRDAIAGLQARLAAVPLAKAATP